MSKTVQPNLGTEGKNVFLKYFSDYPPKISFWTQEDRNNYMDDLEKILKIYLTTKEEFIYE